MCSEGIAAGKIPARGVRFSTAGGRSLKQRRHAVEKSFRGGGLDHDAVGCDVEPVIAGPSVIGRLPSAKQHRAGNPIRVAGSPMRMRLGNPPGFPRDAARQSRARAPAYRVGQVSGRGLGPGGTVRDQRRVPPEMEISFPPHQCGRGGNDRDGIRRDGVGRIAGRFPMAFEPFGVGGVRPGGFDAGSAVNAAHRLLEQRPHGLDPGRVPRAGDVHVVAPQGLRIRPAVLVKQDIPEARPEDPGPVFEVTDQRVDAGRLDAMGMVGRPAPGRHLHEHDAGPRRRALETEHHGLDAPGNILGRVVGQVVRTDHEHHGLGIDSIERPVIDAPEQVLGTVSADAEARGMKVPELAAKEIIRRGAHPPSRPAETLGNGIAEEDHVHGVVPADAADVPVLVHPGTPVQPPRRRGAGLAAGRRTHRGGPVHGVQRGVRFLVV